MDGNSLYFNNTYIETPCGDNGFCDFSVTNFTISLWVKTTDKNSTILHAGTGDFYKLYLENGMPAFAFSAGNGAVITKSPVAINNNKWWLITAVRQGKTARLYVNGSLKATATDPGTYTSLEIASNLFMGRNVQNSQKFKGYLDEVAIYKSALSTSEIAQIFYRERYGQLASRPGNSFSLAIVPGTYNLYHYSLDYAGNWEPAITEQVTMT